ncbi:glycoside hydrolase [Micromonospora sp. PLK6-60]|uniref:WD40/YVTN/BNR-like repeat-containing protein n=1 Tax=Micromonospora sp. PLK6-60 TaxID=2873383 RepID=UPI001CA7A540|nr:sialidase family protein [Micromonospora sp. PLK6-60]MBY8873676.1 glycoside hydrolase [Micromonospora sp. PLK6-60]
MPEREFPGFDPAAVAAAVRQPPLDDLWANGRARRRRRAAGVALALVVAVAGMAAAPLAGGRSGVDPAGPDLSPPRDRATQLYVTGPGTAVGVEFLEHGCAVRFAFTTDSGRSWSDYDAARYQKQLCLPDNLLSPDDYLPVTVLGQRSILVRDEDSRLVSTDGGRTWDVASTAIRTVPAFPPDARPVYCQQQGCAALTDPLAVDPSTGRVYQLGAERALVGRIRSSYPTSAGTIWLLVDQPDGTPQVIRVSDQGTTWRPHELPPDVTPVAVVGNDQREAYLLAEPNLPAGQQVSPAGTRSRLLHTTNGGDTWTEVDTDLPATAEMRWFSIGADGALLVAETGFRTTSVTSRVFVSRDGGRHFAESRRQGGDGGAGAGPGAAWLYGRDDRSALGADHVQFTTDGRTWTRYPLPE